MFPFEKLKANLDKLENSGGKTAPVVKKLVQEYENQANEADRQLDEKQAQEFEELIRSNECDETQSVLINN